MPQFTIHFPIIFVLAPIILLVWYIFFREKNGFTPPNPLLKKYLKTPKSLYFLWFLRGVSLVILFAMGAGISASVVRFVPSPPESENIIVLDISRSMLAEEKSTSRLDEAKKVIKDFVQNQKSQTFGLVIFAGKPFLVISKSQDSEGIQKYISQISVDSIRQNLPGLSGTNIADALLLASDSFSEKPFHKQIILITDGDKNLGSDPAQIATQITNKGIQIHTIALVPSDPSKPLSYTDSDGIVHFLQDEKGQKVYGIQNPSLLQKIATNGNGQFFESKKHADLEKIFQTLSKSKNAKNRIKKKMTHIGLGPVFLILFLLVFGVERSYTKYLFGKVFRGK